MKKLEERLVVTIEDFIKENENEKENIHLLIGNGFNVAMSNYFDSSEKFDYTKETKEIIENVKNKIKQFEDKSSVLHYYFANNLDDLVNIEEFIYELMKIKAVYVCCEHKVEEIQVLDDIYKEVYEQFSQTFSNKVSGDLEFRNYINSVFTTNYIQEFQYYCLLETNQHEAAYMIDGKKTPNELFTWFFDQELDWWKDFEYTKVPIFHVHGGFMISQDKKEYFKSFKEFQASNKSVPYIVLSGNKQSKLEQIEDCEYTKRCFDKFKQIKNKVLVIGNSLSNLDMHLVDELNTNENIEQIIIAIFSESKEEFVYELHNQFIKFNEDKRRKLKFIHLQDKDDVKKLVFK